MTDPDESQLSSLYVELTHLEQLNDKCEMGVKLVPFPSIKNKPRTTTLNGDIIPKCSFCGGFYNKFNYNLKNAYTCSLCGSQNSTSIILDKNNPEMNDCIYDAIPQKIYNLRKQFILTEFFIISLEIVIKYPNIFDIIEEACNNSYLNKNYGIAFLHGAITVVKFKNTLQFQTFIEEPICKISQLFIPKEKFCENLRDIKKQAMKLKYCFCDNVKNAIKFSMDLSLPLGTSLRFILNEGDFHSISNENCHANSLNALKVGTQISFALFINELKSHNPLLDFPIITGGFLRFFSSNMKDELIKNILVSLLSKPLLHDTYIYVRAPDGGCIVDYAGKGFMRTNKSISVSKIDYDQIFYIKFNIKKTNHHILQFIIFYTTDLGLKRFRVITTSIPQQYFINYEVINQYIYALISHSLIIEGKENTKYIVENLKKQFRSIQFDENGLFLSYDTNLIKFYENAMRFSDEPEKI